MSFDILNENENVDKMNNQCYHSTYLSFKLKQIFCFVNFFTNQEIIHSREIKYVYK